ncbi:helicase-related protein [Priestia endophytica]|uniref:helicase-related protein n=1 Tax=Priestia endophytica TaxID=135735 RepID=UPI000DCA8AA5|nr:helicase-related protein [Priestia endophytica]RAS80760.1 helicase [Priestia endophytica]
MVTKTEKLKASLENREHVINSVREEIIGPMRIRKGFSKLDPIGSTIFDSEEELYKPYYWNVGEIKEEILQRESPIRRYVSGQLFPIKINKEEDNDEVSMLGQVTDSNMEDKVSNLFEQEDKGIEKTESEGEIELLPQSSDFKPSSMGLTFCINKEVPDLSITVRGGTYTPYNVKVKGKEEAYTWWLRESLEGIKLILIKDLLANKQIRETIKLYNGNQKHISQLEINLQARIREVDEFYIITLSITNQSTIGTFKREQLTLFQSELEVETGEGFHFSIYPKPYQLRKNISKEEASTELLYRNQGVYAFGHGCATNWDQRSSEVNSIKTTFMPEFETESMTPDISTENGPLKIRMSDLAALSSNEHPKIILKPLIEGYSKWINEKEEEVKNEQLPKSLKEAASDHLRLCKESLTRMEKGLNLLDDPKTLKAFQLANLAILLQQENGKIKRSGEIINDKLIFNQSFEETVKKEETLINSSNSWRAFQIAFFLMSIESFVDERSDSREIVDLIWFPTGGGKTEAYLGVAAFQMLLRRLNDPADAGVDIIMRYTLRLLTADQFQRSSRLMCALEYIRRKNEKELGMTPYSIGIWVGSKTTPNKNKDAKTQLRLLAKNNKDAQDFVIHNCPWCGAKLGSYPRKGSEKGKPKTVYFGYKIKGENLLVHCPDKDCNFHEELPVYIVDETIYQKCPTFLIGTVDKFVQLVWEPKARSLFGIDKEGQRFVSPPSLIIQDELHLISGPLGSLSGLFEVLIEELCLKEINGDLIKPKIIAATATIKQFDEQVLALFGREKEKAQLFPSPGLTHDDSFFAKPARDSKTGKIMPGRKYVGVYTNVVKIMMSQVMTFSAILQASTEIKEQERDPFWTLLAFYNTLRDLGAGLTLTQTDIPQYSNSMVQRKGLSKQTRHLNNVLELTSRKQSHEISKTIDDLKVKYNSKEDRKSTIDLCLSSNIIEVGVDIDRLSTMAIVGQPKMTAQYIQVSGRVGRNWWERPGVIFTLYSNTRSRDKSHFEHFTEYHQRLYAQVEPTSVTPFSDSCLDRGLKAIIVGFLRQALTSDVARAPHSEYIKSHLKTRILPFYNRIVKRAELVDPEQVSTLKALFKTIIEKFNTDEYTAWKVGPNVSGFMYPAGSNIPIAVKPKPESMMNSMRNVDAECRGIITSVYKPEKIENTATSWGDIFQ